MIEQILNNLWLVGAGVMLLALGLKLAFRHGGPGSRYLLHSAARRELAGEYEGASRMRTRHFKYSGRSRLYFWPLFMNATLMLLARAVLKI